MGLLNIVGLQPTAVSSEYIEQFEVLQGLRGAT